MSQSLSLQSIQLLSSASPLTQSTSITTTKKQRKAKILKSVPSVHRLNLNCLMKKVAKKNRESINKETLDRIKKAKIEDDSSLLDKNTRYFGQSNTLKYKELRKKV